MHSKNIKTLKEIAATKDSRENSISRPTYKSNITVTPNLPNKSGVDATERVNRLYYQFLKQG
jgi:hypothetical protein